jgi:hypothetical protein
MTSNRPNKPAVRSRVVVVVDASAATGAANVVDVDVEVVAADPSGAGVFSVVPHALNNTASPTTAPAVLNPLFPQRISSPITSSHSE